MLRNAERLPTQEELQAASLQFVRKISGYRKPSRLNEKAFNVAVKRIAEISGELFENLDAK